MSDRIELFFDPVCPFCWATSRWVEEVRASLGFDVRYRPIALRFLNPDEDLDTPLGRLHVRGLQLLRVAQAAAEVRGEEVVGPLYTAMGQAIHEVPAEGDDFGAVATLQATRPEDLGAVLRSVGLPEDLAGAVADEGHDAAIRASTRTALDRAGEDVGTPILTFGPPDGPSFFGPVLSEVPRGDEAVRLFEATRVLAEHRPFTEFKRSLRALPDTAALAAIR